MDKQTREQALELLSKGYAINTVAIRVGAKPHQISYLKSYFNPSNANFISESEIDLDEVEKYHKLGYTNRELSSVLNANPSGISRALKKLGLTKNESKYRSKNISQLRTERY